MITAVIVPARMGSTRLPGKVMQELRGKPVLAHVLDRCCQIPGADIVVCAVPDERASAPLEIVAKACGADVSRGPEGDVLSRYVGASHSVEANIVVRVPEVCGTALRLYQQEHLDYAGNNMPRSPRRARL